MSRIRIISLKGKLKFIIAQADPNACADALTYETANDMLRHALSVTLWPTMMRIAGADMRALEQNERTEIVAFIRAEISRKAEAGNGEKSAAYDYPIAERFFIVVHRE